MWLFEEPQLLSFETPHLDKFQDVERKAIHHINVKTLNLSSLEGMEESRWTEFFGPDVSPKGSWWSVYKLPVEKWTADLQWRIVHSAIAINRVHLDPELTEGCIRCSQTETIYLFRVLVWTFCLSR